MKGGNQVGAVIYGEMGSIVQSSIDVLVVSCLIFTLDGIGGYAILDQGGSNIVLGAQGVRGAENNIGPPIL